MSSTLSPSAIHRIIFLVENDDRPANKSMEKSRPPIKLPGYCYAEHELQQVNSKWKAIYKLYMGIKPAPPLDSLNSLELALVLKGQVDDTDLGVIFAHRVPWAAGQPNILDVTITDIFGLGSTKPSEAWPQAYTAYLPCYACSTVETVERRSIPRRKSPESTDPVGAMDVAVEKFHVSSSRFGKQLTVELHFELIEGNSEAKRGQSSVIHKICFQLTNETCPGKGRLSDTASRSRATLLLLPEFASEVLGFLDRAHIGSPLLANRRIYDLIERLKQRLPVHHITCAFHEEMFRRGCRRYPTGNYWIEIHHRQRDLSYTDVRRFKIPSTAGAKDDCALLRNYLSNSYLDELRPPRTDNFPFVLKMLASLAACNVFIGHVDLLAEAHRLSDYRSLDGIFGEMQMNELELICDEHQFVEFVKTTDFVRMSSIQRLRELKLTLVRFLL